MVPVLKGATETTEISDNRDSLSVKVLSKRKLQVKYMRPRLDHMLFYILKNIL